VDLTQYSDIVVPGTLAFSLADVGRQFRPGNSGQAIEIVGLSGANLRLARPWADATGAGVNSTILDAYYVAPEDFGHFIKWSVIDQTNQWFIHTGLRESDLNRLDPGRTTSGDLRVLAAAAPRVSDGRVQFEAWPYQTAARRYPALYYRRPVTLLDTDFFGGVFRHRTDVIILAALWWAAITPALGDAKNPWHDLNKANMLNRQVEDALKELAGKDEDIALTWLQPGMMSWNYAPLDANYMAERDFALSGSYGFGYYGYF
jgi:hypothetical protein